MEHCTPLSITAVAFLLVVWQSRSILATETNDCSCYSLHKDKKSWEESNNYCKQMNGSLVSMETEEEYQFINNTIQSLDVTDKEWHIGLSRKSGNWKWISGHSLTINKWRPTQPSRSGDCVKMMKDYQGLGLFDNIDCRSRKVFICEYNQALSSLSINKKLCFSLLKPPTTKETTTSTTATPTHATTTHDQGVHSYSSTPNGKKSTVITSSTKNGQQTEAFVQTTEPEGDANGPQSKSSGSSPFPLVIVTVTLGVVLAVSVCLLVFVCYWKRRNKGEKNKNQKSETTSLPGDAIEHPSNNNQGSEGGDTTEGVQLFHQHGGDPYVAYAVIHNNLTQQNQGPAASNEPAYASIVDEKMIKSSSQISDQNASMPAAATMNAENSDNSVGGDKSNTEVLYASVDKSKKNNIKNESQDGNQVVYASVDKSKKSKARAEDVVYAEIGSKDNTEKQQPYQITYAELADFNQKTSEEAVKPAPYQSAEYAFIIGQKQKS